MLEKVARAVQTHLQNDLAAQLAAVQAYWTSQGSTLALAEPETWLLGFHPTVVERPREDYPIIAVTALEEDPDRNSHTDQWGYGEGVVPAIINWFVAADSEANCNLYLWRYGEAIDAVMRDHNRLAERISIAGDSYIPSTDTTNPYRQPPPLGSEGDYFWTQMGMKTFRVKVIE